MIFQVDGSLCVRKRLGAAPSRRPRRTFKKVLYSNDTQTEFFKWRDIAPDCNEERAICGSKGTSRNKRDSKHLQKDI
jgi:hypothetical protein